MRKSTLFSLALLLSSAVTVWTMAFQKPDTKLHVNFLDIGQGDSIYVRLPTGEDFIMDGGPNEKVVEELGNVMPLSDRTIDLLIASHPDQDHIAGLIDVLKDYDVKEIWLNGAVHTTQTYLDLLAAIKVEKEQGAVVKVVKRGEKKDWPGTTLTVLAPFESWEGKKPDEQNAASIVARLVYKNVSIMLTGDLEIPQEERLVSEKSTEFPLESTILKVGHHGSAGSTGEPFIDVVKPKLAVISVGFHNRYHHPTQRVLDLLKLKNIPTYRTDQNGRVEVISDGETYQVKTEK